MEDAPPSQRPAKRKAPYGPHPRAAKGRRVGRRRQAVVPKFPRYFADQPMRKFAKLKYVKHEIVTGPAANLIVVNEYRANGMYDPEVAVGGHQPMGFDQLMEQYNHYTVLRAVCEIENMSAIYYNNVIACGALSAESGAVTASFNAGGVNGIREMPITSRDTLITIGQYDQASRTVRLVFDAPKFFGKTAWNLIGDSRFQGTDSADPTEDAVFSLVLYSPNLANESGHNFPFKVSITYYAVFTEPKWFTTS